MCGLVGLIERRGACQAALARTCRAMADRLRHRGPDDSGVWCDADAGVALGHRRLSIIDLSAAGHQPMVSCSGRYLIAFNGEIYNYMELRRELEAAGVPFRGHSDTEVLLAGIERWGLPQALVRSNGMFALALWDRETRTLQLARDRMGQKPLYYGWLQDSFVFASELKAIDAGGRFERAVDRSALALFLRHGYVPEPRCIWQGMCKLSPGSVLTMSAADVADRRMPEPVRYWGLQTIARTGARSAVAGDGPAEQELDRLLRDAVGHCMVSDVPVGAFLSGGIDSSLVVALMQAQSSRPVRTFTIGFREDRYDEAAYARVVAGHLKTDHREIYVTNADALAAIPSLPSIYDEPFADSSQIPTYLLSRLARESVTVSLSGDGGDELFGGYDRYGWGMNIARLIRTVPAPLRRLAARTMRALPVGAWEGAAGVLSTGMRNRQVGDKVHKLAEIIEAPSPEAAYGRLVSLWQNPAVVLGTGVEPPAILRSPGDWPEAGSFLEWMMLADSQTYLPGDILTKVDRASMSASLETRIPLLDHRLVEFAWRLPASMKRRHGAGKWLLRQVLRRYVPGEIVDRPKMGFGVPISAWLRGPLREWAETLLDEGRLRQAGYFAPGPIRQKWAEHLSGLRNWQAPLWAILMFQAWLEHRKANPGI